MKQFLPYKNESDAVTIAELSIENRIDRVSIFGSIDLTKDKLGLAAAKVLKKILDDTVSELQASDLPDRLPAISEKTIENPFK